MSWTAEDIVEWRFRLNLKQIDAARMLGRSRTMLSHYEGGKHDIPDSIEDLCKEIERRSKGR